MKCITLSISRTASYLVPIVSHLHHQTVRNSKFNQGLADVEEDLSVVEGGGQMRGRAEAKADPSTISHLNLNGETLIFSDCFDDDWLGTLRQHGVLIDTSNCKPLDYLKYLFPNYIFDTMTNHTN